MAPPATFLRRSRGSVIVVILALITLAAFLLARFIERSMTELLVESRARQGERLRADAHSALEATLAVLADYQALDNGLRSPAQGWGEPLHELELPTRAGTTVAVRIQDESGRPSLPRLEAPALAALGRQLGLKEEKAASLADALLAWTRPEHRPARYETDPRQYEFEDPPHRPPARPLESFDELAAIAVARELFYTPHGQPAELRGRFVESVSLQDFPAVNLNTAGPDTLALAGLDAPQVEKIRDFNAGKTPRAPGAPPYFRSVAEARALLGAAAPLTGFDTLARCLRIEVTVQEGPVSFQLAAVVSPVVAPPDQPAAPTPAAGENLQYPFTLLALEENMQLAPPPVL